MPWLLKEDKLIHTKNGLTQTTFRTEILSPTPTPTPTPPLAVAFLQLTVKIHAEIIKSEMSYHHCILLMCFVSVYATTAANPHESSYACYYDQKRGVYLGDVYSVKWMENSDAVCVIAPMDVQEI